MTTSYLLNVTNLSTAALREGDTPLREFLQYLIARAGSLAKDKQQILTDEHMLTALKKEKKELTTFIQSFIGTGTPPVSLEDTQADRSTWPLDLLKAITQLEVVDSFLPLIFTEQEVNEFISQLPIGQKKSYYVNEARNYERHKGKLFDMPMFMSKLDEWM